MVQYTSHVKKFLLVAIVAAGSFFLWNYAKSDTAAPVKRAIQKAITKTTENRVITPQKTPKLYLFVPYWSFTKTIDTNGFDSAIYFGVGVNSEGIETNDKGYTNLASFVAKTGNIEKILAIRMVDKTINAEVIKSLSLEDKIASQAVSLAVANGFNGVLLDYETSAFAFDSTTNNITSFYKVFASKVKGAGLPFYVTLYGDTYFQSRPFDIKQIGNLSDKVFIMAYDFSKSGGNPGPDFPLTDNNNYGYDFGKLVKDFQTDVDNQKLVVTLGYFGYDWRVDKDGNALADGIPLSLNEITKEFITKCGYRSCVLARTPDNMEPNIKYLDDGGEQHIVWFEDEISLEKKREFLKSKGILQTAAWAYSYF